LSPVAAQLIHRDDEKAPANYVADRT